MFALWMQGGKRSESVYVSKIYDLSKIWVFVPSTFTQLLNIKWSRMFPSAIPCLLHCQKLQTLSILGWFLLKNVMRCSLLYASILSPSPHLMASLKVIIFDFTCSIAKDLKLIKLPIAFEHKKSVDNGFTVRNYFITAAFFTVFDSF